jgi:uncharacterized protein with HEPN domain
MTRNDNLLLNDIKRSCEYILEFTKSYTFGQFTKDEKTRSAVIQKFEIIGEAAKNIPETIKQKHSSLPWKEMAGMRDLLIHAYFGIDDKLVWDTIQNDIPSLLSSITAILEK